MCYAILWSDGTAMCGMVCCNMVCTECCVVWCDVLCSLVCRAMWLPCNLEICCGGLVRWYGMGKVVWCDVVKCVSGLMWYGGVVCCDLVCGCLILLFG